MVEYENECVDCGLPCMGDACPYRKVPRYYCDECGDEEELFEYDGQELCIRCIKNRLTKVNE